MKEKMNYKRWQNSLPNIYNPCMKNMLAMRLLILSKTSKTHVYNKHHYLQYWSIGATPCSPKELACLCNALREEPRWKVFCTYNEGVYITNEVILHLPYNSLTTHMTLWLPITFRLYMTLHIQNMSFILPLYNTFWIVNYIIHNDGVAYDNSWHDMTWHC